MYRTMKEYKSPKGKRPIYKGRYIRIIPGFSMETLKFEGPAKMF